MEALPTLKIAGIMSGTSLDGLDIALCEFSSKNGGYAYRMIKARTIPYEDLLRRTLREAHQLGAEKLAVLHHDFGIFIGDQVKEFLRSDGLAADAVASHGHTVFHQPVLGISVQIGSGAAIASRCGLTTVVDFRSTDVALGGQGAPLVPAGDKLLFRKYAACLNIGGIANISFDNQDGERQAFDICFANMALNYLAEKSGKAFDDNGDMASQGKLSDTLLNEIRTRLRTESKLSLAREQFESLLQPLLDETDLDNAHKLATFCEYMAIEIAEVLESRRLNQVLVTGGGAFNGFLMERLRHHYKGELVVPDRTTVEFKEALIFAFLGYLRLNSKVNSLRSVTGARRDSIGGAVYLGSF